MENAPVSSLDQVKSIQKALKPIVEDNTVLLSKIPKLFILAVAKESGLTFRVRYNLIVALYVLGCYMATHRGVNEDSFSVYWHHRRFVRYYFYKAKPTEIKIFSSPIDSLKMPSGETFVEFIQERVGCSIFNMNEVALYGGISRLALKLFVSERMGVWGVKVETLIQAELPVNDVDVIETQKDFTGEPKFNERTWWAIIVNNIESEIKSILETRDCTFNQCIIYKGRLYYTQKALEASSTGSVVFLARDGDIFGKTVTMLKDGKQYINKNGLYRALGYLVRGKAKKLLIYKENLELEVPHIGKLWVVLLMKKIITIRNDSKRKLAIEDWFNCALKFKITTTTSPKDFLEELLTKFPETKENTIIEKELWFYNFETWPMRFLKRAAYSIVEMFINPEHSSLIQGMSDEMVTIDQNFFRGKHHNTEELLDFIDSFKNE